ncbi:MAG: hypothetical protein AB7F88_03485 [Pyrinomonadaceae bacterium]
MRSVLLVFLVFAAPLVGFSQGSARVGDEVRYQCFCFGQEWVRATVVAVNGGNVRVRFGNMDNQVVTLPINSPKLRLSGAAGVSTGETRPPDNVQKMFAAEAAPKYRRIVSQFAHFYDPQFNYTGGPVRPEEWRSALAELAALDGECRSRYRGVRDFQGITYIKPGDVDYRFAVWCDIAAKRAEIEPRARSIMAKQLVNLGYTDENLNFGFNEPDNPVRMETQQLIWDREKWRVEKLAWLRPKYAEYGAQVPSDVFDAVEKRADELKAMVLRDAPGRSYKQPPHHDAAVESFMRRQFAKEYPGVQVLKIGLDYTTWVQRKSLSYVGSDEIFRYYKVSYNSYKRGTALLKIPNRPLCQTQDWVVGRGAKGLVAVAVGGSGTFMRCG